MTPIALHPGLPPVTVAGHAAPANPDATKVDPKLAKAAQEFEAIFIRSLLKPLESAGKMAAGGQEAVSSGSGVYGSMMVNSLADSASSGGGIGLAHMILEALTRASTPSADAAKTPAVPADSPKNKQINRTLEQSSVAPSPATSAFLDKGPRQKIDDGSAD